MKEGIEQIGKTPHRRLKFTAVRLATDPPFIFIPRSRAEALNDPRAKLSLAQRLPKIQASSHHFRDLIAHGYLESQP